MRRSLGVKVGALLATGAIAFGVAAARARASSDAEPRRGSDPLSVSEIDAARLAAVGTAPAAGRASTLLRVERNDDAKDAAGRRADVFRYDYATDTLTVDTVDLATAKVVASVSGQDTQLPLIAVEAERARTIALSDSNFRRLLTRRAGLAAHRAVGVADIVYDPIVFVADSMPNRAQGNAMARCGRHRCAQLMLRTTDDILIDLLPVVDLSSGRLLDDGSFFRGAR